MAKVRFIRRQEPFSTGRAALGGEVISETDASGKKKKTFVRAAGAQLAYQSAYYSENSPLHESVVFEYSDASGMSQRTTDKTGAAVATGDGGDGSPAELDPMGGNVGTATPYFEPVAYYPEPAYPVLLSLFDDSPMYVNGLRVTATLDGMAVPVSMAMNALNNGSAIPAALEQYQHHPNFRFESGGLGLFTFTVPLQVGWHVNPNQSVIPIYSQFSTRSFTFAMPWSNSRSPQQQQTQQTQSPKKDTGADLASRVLADPNSACAKLFDPAKMGMTPDKFLATLLKEGNVTFPDKVKDPSTGETLGGITSAQEDLLSTSVNF